MKILNCILLIFLFTIISCGDEDSDTDQSKSLVEQIKGDHTGLYQSMSCSLPQTDLFADSQSSLSIIELTDSTISAELIFNNNNIQNIVDFTGTTIADSSLSIDEFALDNNTNVGFINLLENGKIRLSLNDGCLIFGSQVITSNFIED